MKKNLFVYLLSGLFLCVGLISCDDKEDNGGDNVILSPRSFYLLSRGNENQNNAGLGYYDAKAKEYIPDYFEQQNGEKLGELAEDMLIYGGKMYITLPGSNSLIVTDLNAKIEKFIKPAGDEPLKPKTLAAYKNNVFVTYYAGQAVAVLDTVTLSITQTIPVGRYPEQMAVSGNKLFVTNSGGLDWENDLGYDKTVSVINLSSLVKEEDIEVVENPTKITVNSQGDLFVISMGDYETIPNTLQKITEKDGKYVVTNVGNASLMQIVDNTLYALYSQMVWNEAKAELNIIVEYIKYNAITGNKESGSFLKNPDIPNPYSLDIDPQTGYYYINDFVWQVTNDLYIFDASGNKTGILETEAHDVAGVWFLP